MAYTRVRQVASQEPTELHDRRFEYRGDVRTSALNMDRDTGRFLEKSMIVTVNGKSVSIPSSIFEQFKYESRGKWHPDATAAINYFNSTGYYNQCLALFATEVSSVVIPGIRKDGLSECADNPTPGFQGISGRGGIVNTPCRITHLATVLSSAGRVESGDTQPVLFVSNVGSPTQLSWKLVAKYVVSYQSDVGLSSDVVSGAIEALPSPVAVNENAAINQAFSNVTAAKLESLVTVAEGKETIGHLKNSAIKLFNLARALRKGKFSQLAPKTWRRYLKAKKKVPSTDVADFFADAWLEIRYAWIPIMLDAEAAVAVLKSEHKLAARQTFRGFDQSSLTKSKEVVFDTSQGTLRGSVDAKCTTRARAGCLCQAKVSNGLSHELGLLNFGTLVWEMIPFSFVVDWFIDVSGWIDTFNANAHYEILASWLTVEESIEANFTIDSINGVPMKSPLTFEVTRSKRTRTTGVGTSGPSINLSLNGYRLVDAVALLRKLL